MKCVATVNPNKNQDPKYRENTQHHIQDNICSMRCLTFSSGMCLNGLRFEFITPCHPLFINSNILNSNR